jgi:hypothetical protein
MHPVQPQPYRPPAILPTIDVSKDPSLPWRTAPPVQATAALGPSDRAAEHWIWQSRFGPIVIEVRGNDVFVNGDRVAPHAP